MSEPINTPPLSLGDLLVLVTASQDGEPARSMSEALAFVKTHKGPTATYLNRLLCAAILQHEGTPEAADDVITDLRYCVEQLNRALGALRHKTL